MPQQFESFEDFWPYYVSQHQDPTCRMLHFAGTTLAFACIAASPVAPPLLAAAPVVGYGLSWIGHFYFEKNKPASFDHWRWSFRGDLRMWKKIVTGQMQAELERAAQLYPAGAT